MQEKNMGHICPIERSGVKMFYECYVCVIEHSSVNVRLMLINIFRRKLCHASECSRDVPRTFYNYTMNTSDNVQ